MWSCAAEPVIVESRGGQQSERGFDAREDEEVRAVDEPHLDGARVQRGRRKAHRLELEKRDRVHESERSPEAVAVFRRTLGCRRLGQEPDGDQLEQRECDGAECRLPEQHPALGLYRERLGRQLTQCTTEEGADLRADDEAHGVRNADNSLRERKSHSDSDHITYDMNNDRYIFLYCIIVIHTSTLLCTVNTSDQQSWDLYSYIVRIKCLNM